MYDSKEVAYILFLDFIKIMTIILIGYVLFKIIMFNYSLGIDIADALSIPYDQTLIMSIGFVNEFIVVSIVLEIIFAVKISNYFSRFKALRKVYLCLYNFIAW